MPTFQETILTLQQYWNKQGCALLQPYDMEVGAEPHILQRFYVRLARNPGRLHTCSLRVGQKTAVTAKIRIGCSTTISFRSC